MVGETGQEEMPPGGSCSGRGEMEDGMPAVAI